MSSSATLDLASIPERVQSEVQRAIQRSIKGVEYFSTSGPAFDTEGRATQPRHHETLPLQAALG